jgi:cytochrome b involved in lipid metabolism
MFFSSHLYIKFDDEWYDIEKMSCLHPNGEIIFKKYKNKDITDTFYNNFNHIGIKDPKKILYEYKIYDKKIIQKLNSKIKIKD